MKLIISIDSLHEKVVTIKREPSHVLSPKPYHLKSLENLLADEITNLVLSSVCAKHNSLSEITQEKGDYNAEA